MLCFGSVGPASAGGNAIGVLMTGTGKDGAAGMKLMREAGARTLAQDEVSCVVYGMPKEALDCGAAEKAVSLSTIPQAILELCRENVTVTTVKG